MTMQPPVLHLKFVAITPDDVIGSSLYCGKAILEVPQKLTTFKIHWNGCIATTMHLTFEPSHHLWLKCDHH